MILLPPYCVYQSNAMVNSNHTTLVGVIGKKLRRVLFFQ
jgi:hypothetical protein